MLFRSLITPGARQKVLSQLGGAQLLVVQGLAELAQALGMEVTHSVASLDHFGHDQEPVFNPGRALLVGFALIGLAGQVGAQAQGHDLGDVEGVRQGDDALGGHGLHLLDQMKQAIDGFEQLGRIGIGHRRIAGLPLDLGALLEGIDRRRDLYRRRGHADVIQLEEVLRRNCGYSSSVSTFGRRISE